MAQEKVTWVYDAKDKLTPELKGMNQQYDKLQQEAKRTESAVSGGMRRSKQSLTEFVDEIPMAGEALRFLQSPAGIAAGAIGGIGLAANKAVGEAEQLNRSFLKIEQMNLNKSKETMESYKESILETSTAIDFMPEKTAKAFFDVQSATGKFGESVEQIVTKVGRFSDAVNADLDASINAAVKQYRNFDIQAGNFDRALRSNIKTVQTGIVTYDELAKVQADYAGTASAANQTIDSANKLFSLFTANAKNTDEAATLTKTAFESLSEANVVNTLEDFNIQVTDASGNLLQIQPIIKNMVSKLEELSPGKVRALKEEVGGTEGMTMLLNQATSQGEELLEVLQKFNNTDADLSKVTGQAEEDLFEIKQGLMTDIAKQFTTIGEGILPVWVDTLQLAKQELEGISETINGFSKEGAFQGLFDLGKNLLDSNLVKAGTGRGASAIFEALFGKDKNQEQSGEESNTKLDQQTSDMLNNLMGVPNQQMQGQGNQPQPDSPSPDPTSRPEAQEAEQETQDVVTGGKRTKVVRVSIENLVNDLEFNTTNVQEGFQDMEEGVKQALIRAVQDAEITLSEG